MFLRNFKRKVSAVTLSEHALIIILEPTAFEYLIRDKIRRERLEMGNFI